MTTNQEEEHTIGIVGDVFTIEGQLVMHGIFSGSGSVEDGQLEVSTLTGEVTTVETSQEMRWSDAVIHLDEDISADQYVRGVGYGTLTMSSGGQEHSLLVGILAAAVGDMPADAEEAYAWEQEKEAEFLELFPDVTPYAMMPIQFIVSGLAPPAPQPATPVALVPPCPYGITHYGSNPLVDEVVAQAMIDEAIAALPDPPVYTAGDHITISENVISAGGFQAPLTAGDHITISEGVISASGFQAPLTAGTNITIENNVISASGGAATPVWHNGVTIESCLLYDTSGTIKNVYLKGALRVRMSLTIGESNPIEFMVTFPAGTSLGYEMDQHGQPKLMFTATELGFWPDDDYEDQYQTQFGVSLGYTPAYSIEGHSAEAGVYITAMYKKLECHLREEYNYYDSDSYQSARAYDWPGSDYLDPTLYSQVTGDYTISTYLHQVDGGPTETTIKVRFDCLY